MYKLVFLQDVDSRSLERSQLLFCKVCLFIFLFITIVSCEVLFVKDIINKRRSRCTLDDLLLKWRTLKRDLHNVCGVSMTDHLKSTCSCSSSISLWIIPTQIRVHVHCYIPFTFSPIQFIEQVLWFNICLCWFLSGNIRF